MSYLKSPNAPPNLRQVSCCATCRWHGGWLDNMVCRHYRGEPGSDGLGIRPYFICDSYEEKKVEELTHA